MRIQSNLTEVISRFRQHRADIRQAVDQTLKPENWLALAKQHAEKTILALAQPAERQFVDGFVRSVTAVAFQGLLITMTAPSGWTVAAQPLMNLGPAPDNSGPRYARPETKRWTLHDPSGHYDPLGIGDEDLDRFFDLIHEWVADEKRWDTEIDREKNPQTVFQKAQFISRLMLSPDLTPDEARARDLLMPHILDFIRRKSEQGGAGQLPAETTDLWLQAVLMQWTAMVQSEFPNRLRAELAALRGRKQKELV